MFNSLAFFSMKFGASLTRLCDSGWSYYKLDYDGLKHKIRLLTQGGHDYSLQDFYKDVISNIEYVNLFIETKKNDLLSRVEMTEKAFQSVMHDESMLTIVKSIKYDEILYNLLQVTSELKDFLKFVMIQKVACNKLFKKFLKYYKNKERGGRLINRIKLNLRTNSRSLVNFHFSDLTLRLTIIMNAVKMAQSNLKNTKGIEQKSVAQSSTPLELSDSMKFDLIATLKKNFKLECLILDDTARLSGLLLNLNIYLGLRNRNQDSAPELMSYIYLVDENCMEKPTYVISLLTTSTLLIITHVGGLRNYSHCQLPNSVIEKLLGYLVDKTDSDVLSIINDKYNDNLTKLTIDNIVSKNLTPKIKYYCRRSRYSIEDETKRDSTMQTLREENDYLISLDQDIYTTSNTELVKSIQFDLEFGFLERYPFSVLTMYSNDINLSTLKANLVTDIDDSKLSSKVSPLLIRKLPRKIMHLVQLNLFNLFKNLSIYFYMLSCYFNVIPPDEYINNHYSSLLNLNLFKFIENIDDFNNVVQLEAELAKDKSEQVISHRQSLQLMNEEINNCLALQVPSTVPSLKSMDSIFSLNSTKYSGYAPSIYWSDGAPFNDKVYDFEDKFEFECDSFELFLEQINLKDSVLNTTIITLLRIWRGNVPHLQDIVTSSQYGSTGGHSLNDENSLCDNYEYLAFREQFTLDYDRTLSFIYFTFIFISLFLTGIELGVLVTILRLKQSPRDVFVIDNLWIFLVLIVNIIVSIMLSAMSIVLSFHRFHPAPSLHLLILYSVNLVIFISLLWFFFILAKLF